MAKSGGLFGRVFGDKSSSEEEVAEPFKVKGGVFQLSKTKAVLEQQKRTVRHKELYAQFRDSMAEDDLDALREIILELLNTEDAWENDRIPKMTRAYVAKSDDFEHRKEVVLLFLDVCPSNTPLGRILCKDIAVNDAVSDFETFVQKRHTLDEIEERASFYGELEKNFTKYLTE